MVLTGCAGRNVEALIARLTKSIGAEQAQRDEKCSYY